MTTQPSNRRADNVEAIAAVTPMQQGMLFHALHAKEQDPYFIQLVFSLEGKVDLQALQRAWQVAADRHQVLRADYRWEEAAKPLQVIYKSLPVSIATSDFRALSESEQRTRLRALLAEERVRGFDFRQAGTLALRLIERGAEAHWLVWSYHHIALDGWSLSLVLGDVLTAYHQITTGRSPSPSAARPYTAYVDWIHKQDQSQALAYWERLLAGAEVPTALPRSEGRRPFAYSEHVVRLPSAETAQLREHGQKLGVTLNTLVQGAWALMLGRYADAPEVVVGVTVSGRSAEVADIDATAGLFINTQPSRVRLGARASVRGWLRDLQTQSLESRRYEHTPLGEIRRRAGISGNENLFDSVLVFENYPLDEVLDRQPSGLRVRPLSVAELYEDGARNTGRNNYPLTLNVIPGAELVLTFAYQCEAFDDARIAELGRQLVHLLHELGARPDAALAEVGLADDHAVAARELGEPAPSVLALFLAHARAQPAQIALHGDGDTCSYGELDAASSRIAHYLHARGVRADDRVGLCAERSLAFVIGLLGIWKAGGAYVPLDPKLPGERLRALVEQSDARIVLSSAASEAPARATGAEVASIEALARSTHGDGPVAVTPHPEQAAYVIFTSGSTGQPKGVVVSHDALARYVQGLCGRLQLAPGASMAMTSTVAADLGHTVLFGALSTGGQLHLIDERRAFDPDAFAAYVAEHAIEVLKIVPSHLKALLHAADPARVLPAKLLVLGGEASSFALLEQVRALRPRCRIVNHYGPTEATVGVATHEPRELGGAASVPIGSALPGVALEVLDRGLNRVPVGVAGELYIGGGRLARGYLRAASATAARFVPDPFASVAGARLYRTGDRVRRLPGGALEFLGRADRQIKLRGHRVELGEIEARLLAHPSVAEAVVVTRSASGGNLQLVAYVVALSSASDLTETLRAHLAEGLPEYMVPAHVIALAKLPLTRNGKVDAAALPFAAQPQIAESVAPANEVEQKLVEVWQEVLRLERVGVTDNFFELGGDSILSLQVVARARRRGLKVTPQQVFERQTIRELASGVGNLTAPARAEPARASQASPVASGRVGLLPAQARFFERAIPARHRYNQSVMLRARRPLDAGMLAQALAQVVAHHDALGLRFVLDSQGAWTQRRAETRGDAAVLWVRTIASDAELAPLIDEAQASLDLAEGPLLRALLIDGLDGAQRLLLAVHHLVIDGVSWRVLLEDLQVAYAERAEGNARPELPEKTSALTQWADRLTGYARSAGLRDQLSFWVAQHDAEAAELPCDTPNGEQTLRHEERVQVRLEPDATETLLRRAPEAYGTQIQELLLTALARALCDHAGRDAVLIELEGHGREDLFEGIDLTRTLGWFTSVFPVRLAPVRGGPETLRAAVDAIKTQLRAVPTRGFGYGVLKYLASEPLRAQLRGLPAPRVTFNYLGQFDQSFGEHALLEPARESSGHAHDLDAPLANRLTVTGQVFEGALSLSFGFSRECFRVETIARLAQSYRAELTALIDELDSDRAAARASE